MKRRAVRFSACLGSVLSVVGGKSVLGQAMQPLAVTGYNQDLIAENSPSAVYSQASAGSTYTSATFDAYNLQNFYSSTYPGASSMGGYVPDGGRFTSAFNSTTGAPTVFQLAPYTANNALEFNLAAQDVGAPFANNGTMSMVTAQPYTTLAFLSCATNAQANKTDLIINYTLNFAGGVTASGTFTPKDWSENSGTTNFAIEGLGQVNTTGTFGSATLGMHEDDVSVPVADQSLLLTSISFSSPGNDFCWALYGISGAVNAQASQGTLVWNGNVNSSLDTTTPNFQGGLPYTAFYTLLFDDSANGTTNVVIQASGATPSAVTFANGSKTYNISGGNLSVGGALTVNGGGTVNISNNQSYGAASTISNASVVNIASPGGSSAPVSFATGSLTLSGVASLNVQNTTFSTGFLEVDSATASFSSTNISAGTYFNLSSNTSVTLQNSPLTTGSLSLVGSTLSVTGGSFNASSSTSLTFGSVASFTNTPFYTGALLINSTGTMNLTGGSLTTPSLNVSTGGVLNVQTPGLIAGTAAGAPLTLSGGGAFVLNGATLNAGGATAYTGSLTGTGGLNLSAGSVTVLASSLQLTGPLTIGTTASSTGYLLIADGSGTAGLSAGGTALTFNISGVGSAGTDTSGAGVIRGQDSTSTVFAGNLVVGAGGAVLSGGNGGSLNLTGVISGTGPVTYSTDGSAITEVSTPATYTGESRMLGATGATARLDQETLQLGVNNGLSTLSGLNFISSAATMLFDMQGHNQTVTYLTGGNSITKIASYAGPSVLTVNAAANTSNTYAGILDGQVTFAKTGPGTQILSSSNTYTGGTNINGGTLIPSLSASLGSGPVTLGGGTLSLPGSGGNLAGFSGFSLNGTNFTPTLSNNSASGVLTLSSAGASNAASSAFATEVINNTVGFTASFTYTPVAGASGLTFTIQNDTRTLTALGSSGASLGYGGGSPILNSASLQYNLSGTAIGFGTNGAVNDSTITHSRGVNGPTVGDPWQVTITYNGKTSTLSENIKDTATGVSGTYNYSANINSLLGGTTSYIGFTAGTAATGSSQTISNFQFSNGNLSLPVSIPNTVGTAVNTQSILTAPGGGVASVGAMSIAAGSTLTLIGNTAAGNGGKLVLQIPSLSIAGNTNSWTGKLDITNGALDIQNASLGDVTNQIKEAFNAGGPVWQGAGGITSSLAAADSTYRTAVGVIINNDNGNQLYGASTALGRFSGANPGAGDILVKYTYFGDANLDGVVDGTDYSRIDSGFETHATGWYNGDFNYDGVINGSDYTLIDNAFNGQSVSYTAQVAADLAAQIAGSSAVPEPAMMTIIATATLGLLRRRRVTR